MRARRLAGFRIWALLGLVLAVAGALLVYYPPTIELAYFDLPDDASVDIPDGAEQLVSGWWILLVVLPHRPRVVRRAATKLTEYRIALTDVLDLRRSRRQDIRDIESVCLALGPYRNLTTLTASTLFLHPNCQVLNHAGKRIYGNAQVDFLQDYSQNKMDRFLQFAVQISAAGLRGDMGGSITRSHAFDPRYRTKEIFGQGGVEARKECIRSLFWKESLRTSTIIRERRVDLGAIFETEPRLRFLLPIRNPIDCALSNLKTGHVARFPGLSRSTPTPQVVQAILDEIFWFASLRRQYPDRFHYFFEYAISPTMLADLARFLRLPPDETWIANALAAMKINPGYEHDKTLVGFYRDYVDRKGATFPELAEGLHAFST